MVFRIMEELLELKALLLKGDWQGSMAIVEELEEMHGWCGTGHVVRLLNTLQGFSTDVSITMSIEQEMKAEIFFKFNQALHSLSLDLKEEIMNEFTSDEKSLLMDFMDSYSLYDEIRQEYIHVSDEEFNRYYHTICKEYSGL